MLDLKLLLLFRFSSFYKILKGSIVILVCFIFSVEALAQREIILNTTGYGFDKDAFNGINPNQWSYIQKFAALKYEGNDARVTAVRLHIQWNQYEPTPGNYQREKIVLAVKAILALNMKVALHFPYQRSGTGNDKFLADEDIARAWDGTLISHPIEFTCPSLYSQKTTDQFHAFVNDVLDQIRDYYPQILYVQMGNNSTEEFYVPNITRSGTVYSGLYEQKAVDKWRKTFLPLRFPGQSTITWGRNTYSTDNAPLPSDGNYNSEIGRDFHRFAAWGLIQQLKGFRDAVKSHSPSLKVLHYISDFGSTQGNLLHLHNSTIPLALDMTDGIYTTDGTNTGDLWRKIMSLDCMKGTSPDKIAAMEFDPEDLGQVSPKQLGIDPNLATEWMERAFKHGATYVHIAMNFSDIEIQQLARAISTCKTKYLSPSYQPPARLAPITENIYPNVFTGTFLFENWSQAGGNNWGDSDNNPRSIKMADNGYWTNIWNTSNLLPCTFTISATPSENKVTVSTPVTLTANCEGSECDAAGYTWSGKDVNEQSGKTITITAPSTDGNYKYTVTSDRRGCGAKTAETTIAVGATLPVALINFTAKKEENAVSLKWSTTLEINSKYFGIERSSNGKNWNTLGLVDAHGESSNIIHYSFLDNSPANGENLYRLKMTDQDQTYAYSRIVNISFDQESFLNVFPNPASDKMTIKSENLEEIKTVEILNVSGQIVYQSAPNLRSEINIKNFPEGLYFVRLIYKNGKKETGKFVKHGG